MSTGFQTREVTARVKDPLDAVRKHIRRYVLLEGAAIVLFGLAIWFWAGMLVDFGLFWATAYDWVLELDFLDPSGQGSLWIRVAVFLLVAGWLGYLLVTRVVLRYWSEFSDSAVALVLERRFPRELGDRLITAVELSDPKKAQEYGFSAAMLEKTINEAAERVEKLPVADVFDWARLYRHWQGVALVTAGFFVVAALGSIGVQMARGAATGPIEYLWDFRDVAGIWGERNVLMRNSYWLRNNHLEIVRFQDNDKHPGEMRVGRDEQRPDLLVRSVEWVVPDRASRTGWRPLRVADLGRFSASGGLEQIKIPDDWAGWIVDLDDLDGRIPTGAVSAALQGKTFGELADEALRAPVPERQGTAPAPQNEALETALRSLGNWRTWTFDKLLLQVAKDDVRKRLAEQHTDSLRAIETLERELTALAESPSMSRRLRKLALPTDIGVVFRGATTRSTAPGESQSDRKYGFSLQELKESVTFFVRGGDFFTPPLKITLVPPPAVKEIAIDKEEPAYLYHRLQGEQQPLKGHKQVTLGQKVSVTGESSTIDVPLGTNLTLRAQVDRPLKEGIRIAAAGQAREAGTVVPDHPVKRDEGGRGFSVRFDNVVKTMEFQFEFNDEDNVAGKRRIRIRPVDDQAPEIINFELAVVLRKPRFKEGLQRTLAGVASEGFLVTPAANLPFNGTVRDDVSLTAVRWAFQTQPIVIEKGTDKDPGRVILQGTPVVRRTGLIVSALQYGPAAPLQSLLAPAYMNLVGRVIELDLKRQKDEPERTAALADFEARLKRLEEITLDQLPERLREKPKVRPHLREHSLRDNENFNLKVQLQDLPMKDSSGAQMFHLVKLAVEAVDNNVETGPSVSRTRTPLLLLVVSETELLSQIAQEEEVLRDRLEKVLQKLRNAQTSMSAQLPPLRSFDKDFDYANVVIRVGDVRRDLLDAASTTRDIHIAYSHILREMEVNNVKNEKISDVKKKIVEPLEETVHPTLGGFALTEEVLARLYGGIDEDVLQKQPGKNLVQHLQAAGQANDQITSLIDQLNAVLLAIDRGLDFNEILNRAIAIRQGQLQVVEPLRIYQDRVLGDLLNELIAPKK